MKPIALLLGFLTASAVALAALAPLESTISAVTVYADRAVVTRSASAELKAGLAELVFANLPESLNEQSLQVSGRGTAEATILDVSAKRTFVDYTPNARVKELEDQLKELAKQNRTLDDRQGLLEAQISMLGKMEAALFAPPAKDVPRADLNQFTTSLNYLTEQKAKIAADRTTLDAQREELLNKINTAQSQLNELRGTGGKAFKTVTVRVNATQPGTLELALAYTVPGASWSPSYDTRVSSGEHAVALSYFGLVRQSTGEDWNDVALTLSTARPSLGGAAPAIRTWNLDVFVRPEPMATVMQAPRAERMAFAKITGGTGMNPSDVNMQAFTNNADKPESELRDANTATATIEAAATSASFKIATAASVPSDNSPQKIPITTARLNANPEYLTTPKLFASAFLTAKVVNSSEFPLLAGAMNVFLNGTFVATSRVRTVMPGEKFDLALGADEGISVKHKRVNKFTEDTGLTNSGKRITYEYLITIQNNKKSAERVIVVDQLPLSRNEKIVVKQLAPDAKEVKPTDEGALKWTLDLKPAEKHELTLKFTVDYPNDVNVTGLE